MNKPHKWSKEIHAWADGAVIQIKTASGEWHDIDFNPSFLDRDSKYRVKPEEKQLVIRWLWTYKNNAGVYFQPNNYMTEQEAEIDSGIYSNYTIIRKIEESRLECFDE